MQKTRPLSADNDIVRFGLADAGQDFHFNGCCHCGLIFREPRPTAEQVHRHYTELLPQLEPGIYRSMGASPETVARRETQRFAVIRTQVQKYSPTATGHIIDVGGNRGHSLIPWLRDGWDATLIDAGVRWNTPAHPQIHAAETVTEALSRPAPAADIITSYHCLEHLLDIKTAVQEMASLTKPESLWVMEVPFEILYLDGLLGPSPLERPTINPQHLNFFTPLSLRYVARLLNLRVLAVKIVVVLYWFGPTVALRLYAHHSAVNGVAHTTDSAFSGRQAFRRYLSVRLPLWRRIAGIKFRYYRFRNPNH